jgi:hypothetical protein
LLSVPVVAEAMAEQLVAQVVVVLVLEVQQVELQMDGLMLVQLQCLLLLALQELLISPVEQQFLERSLPAVVDLVVMVAEVKQQVVLVEHQLVLGHRVVLVAPAVAVIINPLRLVWLVALVVQVRLQ